MKHSPIPNATRTAAARIEKKNTGFISCAVSVPESAIEGITHGDQGAVKVGLRCWIIGGDERTIFTGEGKHTSESKIPEFAVLLESGSRFWGQYGRDFVFTS